MKVCVMYLLSDLILRRRHGQMWWFRVVLCRPHDMAILQFFIRSVVLFYFRQGLLWFWEVLKSLSVWKVKFPCLEKSYNADFTVAAFPFSHIVNNWLTALAFILLIIIIYQSACPLHHHDFLNFTHNVFLRQEWVLIIIIIIIRVYLNRPELILSRGCGLAAQSWSQTSSPCLAVFGVSSFHAK